MNVILLGLSIAVIAFAPSLLVYFILNIKIRQNREELVDNMKAIYPVTNRYYTDINNIKSRIDKHDKAMRENMTYLAMRRNSLKDDGAENI